MKAKIVIDLNLLEVDPFGSNTGGDYMNLDLYIILLIVLTIKETIKILKSNRPLTFDRARGDYFQTISIFTEIRYIIYIIHKNTKIVTILKI